MCEEVVRTQLRIPKELWTEVKCIAPRLGCSANEAIIKFVREAMSEYTDSKK